MHHHYSWISEQGNGQEYLVLEADQAGALAEGLVIGRGSGVPYEGFGVSYTIGCDAHWRVRRVDVKVVGGAHLQLWSDGEGRWTGPDGKRLPALDGCIDVDLSCTPFTNTLPIRRLAQALSARHEIRVAYITLPEASVMPSRQAYTALGDGRYLFESLSDPFQATVETDADGLVTCYPGLFRRAGSGPLTRG